MTITDKLGVKWDLKDAIVRILIEKYPQYLSSEEISSILDTHPSFIRKTTKELRESNILLVQGSKYQIKGGLEGGRTVGRVMEKSGEGYIQDEIFYFKGSSLREIFIAGHKSKYFEYPFV